MKFKVGQRVLVHQSSGLKITDSGLEDMGHDCSDPKLHWESRVLGYCDFHKCPRIATSAKRNPCHADWPYYEDSLTPLKGDDWADKSQYKAGKKVRFKWPIDYSLHYPLGKVVDGKIRIAHIEPGDWYVGVMVRSASAKGFEDWEFKIVVNEKDFL